MPWGIQATKKEAAGGLAFPVARGFQSFLENASGHAGARPSRNRCQNPPYTLLKRSSISGFRSAGMPRYAVMSSRSASSSMTNAAAVT